MDKYLKVIYISKKKIGIRQEHIVGWYIDTRFGDVETE